MSATKKCTNCGAENDLLLTNCLYCKSSLPQVDVNSISNEELILKAGEWVGKVGQNYEEITKDFNAWTGKGRIEISSNQIEGLALKYLSLLQVRSVNNSNLLMAYTDLKRELDIKRSNIFYKLGIDAKFRPLLIYIAILAVVGLLLAIIL